MHLNFLLKKKLQRKMNGHWLHSILSIIWKTKRKTGEYYSWRWLEHCQCFEFKKMIWYWDIFSLYNLLYITLIHYKTNLMCSPWNSMAVWLIRGASIIWREVEAKVRRGKWLHLSSMTAVHDSFFGLCFLPLSQSGKPRMEVPLMGVPSLSTHQQKPVACQHCTGL